MNIMLDLETMGNGSNAAIVAIGAVAFDVNLRTLGSEFYRVVDLASSMESGGVCDASTIMWWMKQEDAARAALGAPAVHIAQALSDFSSWYAGITTGDDDGEVWGNGATSDNVWLANAYRRLSLIKPWTYKKDRCFRTVRALYPNAQKVEFGVAHNALDDAKAQALSLIAMLNPLFEGTPK